MNKEKETWEVEFEHLFGYEIREVQKEFPGYLSHDPDIKNFISDLLKKREEEWLRKIYTYQNGFVIAHDQGPDSAPEIELAPEYEVIEQLLKTLNTK